MEGLEPPTFSLSARRSNQAEPHPCIGHDGDRCRVGVTGLEPATLRSQSGRATTCATPRNLSGATREGACPRFAREALSACSALSESGAPAVSPPACEAHAASMARSHQSRPGGAGCLAPSHERGSYPSRDLNPDAPKGTDPSSQRVCRSARRACNAVRRARNRGTECVAPCPDFPPPPPEGAGRVPTPCFSLLTTWVALASAAPRTRQGSRTPTSRRTLGPEPSASASSAKRASGPRLLTETSCALRGSNPGPSG